MKSIKEMLYDLVGIQSDSGTRLEINIANRIYEMISEEEYFKNNQDLYGAFRDGDLLDRPVVWALKKGKTNKTIILSGHYDAVEIKTYGPLEEYALKPDILKEAFKRINSDDKELRKDLLDEDWAFGRGIADMKAGVAINLHTLFNDINDDVNILFTAVPDEENLSSGAIQSIKLYEELKFIHNLDYKIAIISEPQFRDQGTAYNFLEGAMGKFLPIIMTKGVLTHSARIFHGLNSGLILSKIIQEVELSTDLISNDRGLSTQPPTVQLFRDLKTTYDVSVPEYSVGCFNFLFLKNKSPNMIIEELKNISREALTFAIEKYEDSFDYMLENDFIKAKERRSFKTDVMTINQLEEHLKKIIDFQTLQETINKQLEKQIRSNEITLQEASIIYMKTLLEESRINHPIVIIGIAPPYYPAVTNKVLDKNLDTVFGELKTFVQDEFNLNLNREIYFDGMCDLSYMSSENPIEERKILNNLTVPKSVYDIPVERISKLNILSILLGPACKDVHKMGERVYMPDVEKNIPLMFENIIKNL